VNVAAQAGPKKDSVELLLDGMPTVQPQPPRTTPQTAGQSSAAYHAEHAVRPAHTSPDDVPKVVVERGPQHQTVRLDRARLQAVIDQAVEVKARRQQEQLEPDTGMPMSLRIAIAIVAGLAVVLGIFLFARASQSSAAPAAVATVAPAAPPVAMAVPAPSVSAAATTPVPAPSDTQLSSTPAILTSPTALPPVSTGTAPRPRPRSSAPAATGGSTDLGEFKTTFH
jgi:hypothetical protein